MQMRPAPNSEAAAKTGILHATKSHIYIHFVSQRKTHIQWMEGSSRCFPTAKTTTLECLPLRTWMTAFKSHSLKFPSLNRILKLQKHESESQNLRFSSLKSFTLMDFLQCKILSENHRIWTSCHIKECWDFQDCNYQLAEVPNPQANPLSSAPTCGLEASDHTLVSLSPGSPPPLDGSSITWELSWFHLCCFVCPATGAILHLFSCLYHWVCLPLFPIL